MVPPKSIGRAIGAREETQPRVQIAGSEGTLLFPLPFSSLFTPHAQGGELKWRRLHNIPWCVAPPRACNECAKKDKKMSAKFQIFFDYRVGRQTWSDGGTVTLTDEDTNPYFYEGQTYRGGRWERGGPPFDIGPLVAALVDAFGSREALDGKTVLVRTAERYKAEIDGISDPIVFDPARKREVEAQRKEFALQQARTLMEGPFFYPEERAWAIIRAGGPGIAVTAAAWALEASCWVANSMEIGDPDGEGPRTALMALCEGFIRARFDVPRHRIWTALNHLVIDDGQDYGFREFFEGKIPLHSRGQTLRFLRAAYAALLHVNYREEERLVEYFHGRAAAGK